MTKFTKYDIPESEYNPEFTAILNTTDEMHTDTGVFGDSDYDNR